MRKHALLVAALFLLAPIACSPPARAQVAQAPATEKDDPGLTMAKIESLRAQQKLREEQVKDFRKKTIEQIDLLRKDCGPPCMPGVVSPLAPPAEPPPPPAAQHK